MNFFLKTIRTLLRVRNAESNIVHNAELYLSKNICVIALIVDAWSLHYPLLPKGIRQFISPVD